MNKAMKNIIDILFVLFAATMGAVATKYFIAPLNLNFLGVYGISVLLTKLGETTLAAPINLDIFRNWYILLNIPLIVFAYFKLGKKLVFNTFIFVMWMPNILKLLPELQFMDIAANKLTATIIGALIFGFGLSFAYKGNGSSGGFDVINIWLSKKFRHLSIGVINYFQTFVVFSSTQIAYNIKFGTQLTDERLIYSLIFVALTGATISRTFPRHKIIKCTIIAKNHNQLISIIKKTFPHKSYSSYNVEGRNQNSKAVDIVMSYYESKDLIRMLKTHDIDNFFYTTRVIRAHNDFAALK